MLPASSFFTRNKMKNSKLVFILIAGIISLALGLIIANQLFNNMSSSMAQEEKNKLLKKEIEDLEQRIEARGERHSSAKFTVSVTDVNVQKSEENIPEMINVSGQTAAENLTTTNNKQSEPLAKPISELPQKFSDEPINEAWAFEQEKKLQAAFAEQFEFQDKELKSIKCKSSTCEIKFYAEDRQELLKTGSNVNYLIINKLSADFKPNIMSVYSDENKTATYYFSGTE